MIEQLVVIGVTSTTVGILCYRMGYLFGKRNALRQVQKRIEQIQDRGGMVVDK